MSSKKKTDSPESETVDTSAETSTTNSDAQNVEQENIDSANELAENTAQEDASKKGGAFTSFIAVVALLIAIAAAGGAWWLWQQLQLSKQTLDQALNQQNQTSQGEINQVQNQIGQLSENLAAANTEIDTKLGQQNAQISTIQTTVDAAASSAKQVAETVTQLHSKLNINPKTGWLIAEAEYLLSIANQQLLLTGDVDTSITALRSADQRLRESADPTVLDVRSIINDEITQLQSVHVIDIAGAALTLASMQSRVNELSLSGQRETNSASVNEETAAIEKSTSEEPKDGWRSALDTALNAVKDLVVIRQRGDNANDPLLTPDQRSLIYQNLRLKLESARLSLIQGDEATYRQSLDVANEWLIEYFDNDAKRNAVSDTLTELGKISLNATMPDISASLDALRTWQRQQNSNAE